MSQNSIPCGREAPPAGRGNTVAPREFPKRGAAAALRHRLEISAPSRLFFCPSAALQKGLHIMDMRPLSRLAAGQNPCAIRLTYFQAMP